MCVLCAVLYHTICIYLCPSVLGSLHATHASFQSAPSEFRFPGSSLSCTSKPHASGMELTPLSGPLWSESLLSDYLYISLSSILGCLRFMQASIKCPPMFLCFPSSTHASVLELTPWQGSPSFVSYMESGPSCLLSVQWSASAAYIGFQFIAPSSSTQLPAWQLEEDGYLVPWLPYCAGHMRATGCRSTKSYGRFGVQSPLSKFLMSWNAVPTAKALGLSCASWQDSCVRGPSSRRHLSKMRSLKLFLNLFVLFAGTQHQHILKLDLAQLVFTDHDRLHLQFDLEQFLATRLACSCDNSLSAQTLLNHDHDHDHQCNLRLLLRHPHMRFLQAPLSLILMLDFLQHLFIGAKMRQLMPLLLRSLCFSNVLRQSQHHVVCIDELQPAAAPQPETLAIAAAAAAVPVIEAPGIFRLQLRQPLQSRRHLQWLHQPLQSKRHLRCLQQYPWTWFQQLRLHCQQHLQWFRHHQCWQQVWCSLHQPLLLRVQQQQQHLLPVMRHLPVLENRLLSVHESLIPVIQMQFQVLLQVPIGMWHLKVAQHMPRVRSGIALHKGLQHLLPRMQRRLQSHSRLLSRNCHRCSSHYNVLQLLRHHHWMHHPALRHHLRSDMHDELAHPRTVASGLACLLSRPALGDINTATAYSEHHSTLAFAWQQMMLFLWDQPLLVAQHASAWCRQLALASWLLIHATAWLPRGSSDMVRLPYDIRQCSSSSPPWLDASCLVELAAPATAWLPSIGTDVSSACACKCSSLPHLTHTDPLAHRSLALNHSKDMRQCSSSSQVGLDASLSLLPHGLLAVESFATRFDGVTALVFDQTEGTCQFSLVSQDSCTSCRYLRHTHSGGALECFPAPHMHCCLPQPARFGGVTALVLDNIEGACCRTLRSQVSQALVTYLFMFRWYVSTALSRESAFHSSLLA